jgi:hypothetical protein
MTIGTSLFLIAVGAILKFAVSVTVEGVDLHTVGVILMVVGGVGLVLGVYGVGLVLGVYLVQRGRSTAL